MAADKRTVREFTVEGRGEFPLDMLRYDCCWPKSGEDVSNIEKTERGSRRVTLYTASHVSQPTVGRWASFGWYVEKYPV